ncbi:hypothetical protein [Streptomyces sp. NPDC057694]|uniref:hypothetical protein n=1 Tax=unclassified Streptomyces TaxID=2593676 RepID=UPI0036D15857
MAGNIALSYPEIERVSGVLDTSVDSTLVPRMSEAKQEVENLLTNGLVLSKSSPQLTDQYNDFNTKLTDAMNAIKSFADQFRQIKTSFESMDADIAEKVASSGK